MGKNFESTSVGTSTYILNLGFFFLRNLLTLSQQPQYNREDDIGSPLAFFQNLIFFPNRLHPIPALRKLLNDAEVFPELRFCLW